MTAVGSVSKGAKLRPWMRGSVLSPASSTTVGALSSLAFIAAFKLTYVGNVAVIYATAPFMAAVMSADLDNTDRLVTLKDDCRQSSLTLAVPSINRSQYAFSVHDETTILYGLGAIKGVGRAAVESLLAEPDASGCDATARSHPSHRT